MQNNTDKLFKDKIEAFESENQPMNWNKEKGWQEYANKFAEKSVLWKQKSFQFSAAAAILMGVFFMFFFNKGNQSAITTAANEGNAPKEIILPDGNKVWLNKNSQIKYPSKFNRENCIIEIVGEAYFEINKSNNIYTVISGNALASFQNETIFNIKSYPNDKNVSIDVKSGIIKVNEKTYEEGMALLVNEGQHCSVHKSSNLVFSTENQNENYLAWKTGKFEFDNTPVITIAKLISDYYGEEIEVENNQVAFCKMSTTFTNTPLNEVLKEIEEQLNLKIVRTGKKYVISGDGCKTNNL